MSASSNNKYLPLSVTLIVFGALLLIDGLVGFHRYGLGWLVRPDNMLLYAAAIYLFLSNERMVGLLLLLVWLFLNLSVFTPLMAGVPFYVVPACLLVVGALMLLKVKK